MSILTINNSLTIFNVQVMNFHCEDLFIFRQFHQSGKRMTYQEAFVVCINIRIVLQQFFWRKSLQKVYSYTILDTHIKSNQ